MCACAATEENVRFDVRLLLQTVVFPQFYCVSITCPQDSECRLPAATCGRTACWARSTLLDVVL